MVKAIYSNGVIRPVGPIPTEWAEGDSLWILQQGFEGQEAGLDSDDDMTPEEIDAHFAEINAMCADNTPENQASLKQALAEAKSIAKEQVRRSMGLS